MRESHWPGLYCRFKQGRCRGGQKRVEEVKESVPFLTHPTFYPSQFSLSLPVSPVLRRLRLRNMSQLVDSNIWGNMGVDTQNNVIRRMVGWRNSNWLPTGIRLKIKRRRGKVRVLSKRASEEILMSTPLLLYRLARYSAMSSGQAPFLQTFFGGNNRTSLASAPQTQTPPLGQENVSERS